MKQEFELIKSWKEAVFKEIATKLEPIGFRLRKGQQSFHRRATDDVVQMFHLNFGSHPRERRLEIVVSVAVRHEGVERLAMGWRSDLSESIKQGSATIGQELGHLVDGQSRVWAVTNEEKILDVILVIWQLMEKTGLPYLERFTDLHETLVALSSDRSPYTHTFAAIRCHRVPVIYALLFGSERALPSFREQYRRLKEQHDPNVRDYPNFVKYMEQHLGIPIPL